MCFSYEMSVCIFSTAIIAALLTFSKRKSLPSTVSFGPLIFYFSIMEGIQVLNYMSGLEEAPWNGGCAAPSSTNKLMVMLGFAHVCFQPFVTHYCLWYGRVLQGGRDANEQFRGILKMLFLAALWDLAYALRPFLFGKQGIEVYDWDFCGGAATLGTNSTGLSHAIGGRHQQGQWFAGNEFCAFKGDMHIGWSIPFPAPTYYMPGMLHFFAFFGPYFCIGLRGAFGGIAMLLTGPILAELVVGGARLEAASTWCFWSFIQTFIPPMVYMVINPYILGRGWPTLYEEKNGVDAHSNGLSNSHGAYTNGSGKHGKMM